MRSVFLFGAAVLAACITTSSASNPWNNPPKGRIAGLEHRTFRSASMNIDVGYNICLPPAGKGQQGRRLPVIYYLHGYDGNESSYLEYVQLWRESLSRQAPTILVLVNGGATSFFADAPDGSVMGETVVVKELVPHIDQSFPTLTNAAGRSLHGYSMGGFGALKLAFKYPGTFGSVVAYGATLSSAAEMQRHAGKIYARMFGRDPARFAESDPLTLLQRNADRLRGHTAIEIIVGAKDDFVNPNQRLHEALNAARIEHVYKELRGVGHKKDPLYEAAAAEGFAFSARAVARTEPKRVKTKAK